MSANAWQRRREGKRFRMALEVAMNAIKVQPTVVVRLDEWGLAVMSWDEYAKIQALIDRIDHPRP